MMMKKMFRWLKREASANPFIGVAGVFLLSFAVFIFYQSQSAFADPDSFYHMKMAQLFWDRGVVKDFVWLSDFTILKNAFANQHFLYHVLLSPFVALLPDAVGAKLLTALLGASVVTVFSVILRNEKVPFRMAWVVALLATAPWMFRINLVKGSGAALLLVLATTWALQRKDRPMLFVIGMLYPLTHFGFPLFLVMVGLWIVAESWQQLKRYRFSVRHASHYWKALSRFLQHITSVAHLQVFFTALSGMILGILLHPWFPRNLTFFWEQFVRIGVVNYRDVIRVGGEWYPYALAELLPNTVFVSLGVLLGLFALVFSWREQGRMTRFALLMTVLTLFMTLKSRRYVEYYVPMALLFSALAIASYMRAHGVLTLKRDVSHFFRKRTAVYVLLITYVVIIVPVIIVRDAKKTFQELGSGSNTQTFSAAMQFTKTHLKQGEVLVHSDWDEFPILFYQNDAQHYIAGLDPTFAHRYDANIYQTWVEISTGTFRGDLGKTLITVFHSRAAFVAKDHSEMMALFDRRADFKRVYEDDEAIIYFFQEP